MRMCVDKKKKSKIQRVWGELAESEEALKIKTYADQKKKKNEVQKWRGLYAVGCVWECCVYFPPKVFSVDKLSPIFSPGVSLKIFFNEINFNLILTKHPKTHSIYFRIKQPTAGFEH